MLFFGVWWYEYGDCYIEKESVNPGCVLFSFSLKSDNHAVP